jgi:hypothetical protein
MDAISRRQFCGHLTGGAILAVAGVGEIGWMYACNKVDVWHEVEAWVPMGIDAFDSIITLVDPIMSPAITTIALLVKSGFTSLSSAIDSYLAAPPADKVTWQQRVKLILSGLGADMQSFLTAIGQTGNPIINLVVLLVQVVVNAVSGFVNAIGGTPAAFPKKFTMGAHSIRVVPTLQDRDQFIVSFNGACDKVSRPDLHIPRTTPVKLQPAA